MTDPVTPTTPECEDRIGAAQLVRLAYGGRDMGPVRDKLRTMTARPGAAMDLSVVEQLLGDRDLGLRIQDAALGQRRCYRRFDGPAAPRLRVLALAAPLDIGGNTPIEFLVADPEVEVSTLYVVPGEPVTHPLPEHDVAIITMPDEGEGGLSLDRLRPLLAHWPRPILNVPAALRQTDRDRLHLALGSIPGLFMPPTVRSAREDVQAVADGRMPAAGLRFPLIVRPVGSHAGQGLERVPTPADLAAYLAAAPASEFFLSNFIDYSGADGLFRKYRVVFVDGKPFPCHMALAETWAVWYLNADMYASAEKRGEEARFMERFDEDFGLRHGAALAGIAARLGLDYVVIDCAETKSGALLVFEASVAMIVHDMDSASLYPYKAPVIQGVFAAFTAMLDRHAAAGREAA